MVCAAPSRSLAELEIEIGEVHSRVHFSFPKPPCQPPSVLTTANHLPPKNISKKPPTIDHPSATTAIEAKNEASSASGRDALLPGRRGSHCQPTLNGALHCHLQRHFHFLNGTTRCNFPPWGPNEAPAACRGATRRSLCAGRLRGQLAIRRPTEQRRSTWAQAMAIHRFVVLLLQIK